jgi:phage tail protein X
MTYETVQGDMWDEIAYKVYGSTKYIGALLAANSSYITMYRFSAGITLTCPDVSEEVSASALPPWKRVSG